MFSALEVDKLIKWKNCFLTSLHCKYVHFSTLLLYGSYFGQSLTEIRIYVVDSAFEHKHNNNNNKKEEKKQEKKISIKTKQLFVQLNRIKRKKKYHFRFL